MTDLRDVSVNYEALLSAQRALKAFYKLYLPYNGLGSEWFWDHFALFSTLEALLYDADTINENQSEQEANAALDTVRGFLAKSKLNHPQFAILLLDAASYFSTERNLRKGLLSPQKAFDSAIQVRSFDFRMLNAAVGQLANIDSTKVFDELRPFEQLMEWDDDKQTMEKDRRENTFNGVLLLEKSGIAAVAQYERTIRQAVVDMSQHAGHRYYRLLESYLSEVPTSVLVD